jgi:hypothetical protein
MSLLIDVVFNEIVDNDLVQLRLSTNLMTAKVLHIYYQSLGHNMI